MDQLSDEQRQKLQQFQDIANLDEMDMAIVTLASVDWDVANAIEAHLGGNPVVRGPRLGLSPEDYVHDFPMHAVDHNDMDDDDDDDGAAIAAQRRMLHRSPDMAEAAAVVAPPRRRVMQMDEDEEMEAAISASRSESSTSTAGGEGRGGAARVEQREAAGRSQRATAATPAASAAAAALAAAQLDDPTDTGAAGVPPSGAVAPVAPAAPAAAPARMEYSDVDDSDDDYDYAMEEQDEDADAAAPRMVAASSNGGGSRDFGVPLIPTDCASAHEGTQNFQSVFEARYGKHGRGHLMPPFFIGSLQSAIREAFDCPDRPVSERRPLALYIHHDRSVARNIFPQAVLCSDGVLQLLRSQFIMWPWDVTAKENQDKLITWLNECSLYDARPIVASFLKRVDSFPLLILLSKDGGQLRMVDFVNGAESADQAMEKLLMCMDAYASSKVSLEKQEQQRQEREALRKEQERELQESLAVDRERAERQAREIREAKEAEERAAKDKEERNAHIAALKSSLPDEPAENAPGCCSIRFRLPEGKTALRRFPNSCTFSSVVHFMESEGFSFKEYRYMNSDFPQKKDVSEWDQKKSLAELKWPAREVINVEER